MVYFTCFMASGFFLWCATKNKRVKIIYEVVGLLLPILLAAYRDITIGADVKLYVVPYFDRAVIASRFIKYRASGDILYDLLNYIISRFTNNIFWLFFLLELIIITFIYLGCKNYAHRIPPWYSMMIFYFIFYQFTLTTVRQSCSLAISFFAISHAIKNKSTKYSVIQAYIVLLLAIGFHASAVFAFAVLTFVGLIVKKKPNPVKMVCLIITLAFIIIIFMERILNSIMRILAIINTKYSNTVYGMSEGVDALGYTTLIFLGIIAVIIVLMNIIYSDDNYWKTLNTANMYLLLIYIIMLLFINGFTYIARILYYLQFFEIIALPQFENIVYKRNDERYLARAMVFVVVIVFWWYYFIHGGVTETYPYMMKGLR